jgi:hypothetical protein
LKKCESINANYDVEFRSRVCSNNNSSHSNAWQDILVVVRAAQSQVDALREEADRTPLTSRSSSLSAASNVVSSVFGLFGASDSGGSGAKTGATGADGAERPDAELADGGSSSGDDLRRHRQAIVLLLMRSISQV